MKCAGRTPGPWRADVDRGQKIAQRVELLERGLVMHAIDQRPRFCSSVSAAATLARIMNSSMSRCASSRSRHDTRSTRAVRLEQDLALRQIEIERCACRARLQQPQYAAQSGFSTGSSNGSVVSSVRPSMAACACCIGELGRRAHHMRWKVWRACGRRGRSSCAPRAPGGPRSGAASTDRSRCARAASARRGRGNRPNCRAPTLRDRAREPGVT